MSVARGSQVRDEARRGRGYDRLVNFSDAVVAIAITLLGLPLVDIEPPRDGASAWTVLTDHGDKVWSFVVTFLVVAVLWLAHHRVFDQIDAYDGAILRLDMLWLLTIVFLPLPSAWMGEVGFSHGVGLLYCLTLALNSVTLWLVVGHIARHPDLLDEDTRQRPEASRAARSLVFAAYFLAVGLLSLAAPDLASWAMLGLIPVSIWQNAATRAA